LPAGVLVAARSRVGKNRQGDRPEAGEAGERLLFLGCGVPPLFLNAFDGADGGDNVAGLRLFAAGDQASGSLGEVFRRSGLSVSAQRVEWSAAVYGSRRNRRGGRRIAGEGIKQRRLIS
jgi:hypothetical protein